MSFGRLKTRLRALINRKDFTPELAGDFILDAMGDLERELRIGPMEFVVDKHDWDGAGNAYPIPSNYLETIRVFTDEGTLDELGLDAFLAYDGSGTVPKVYTRIADRWLIKPAPPAAKYVYLFYYGETARPVADADTTLWTNAGFLATLYKAAELAADFYQMEPDIIGTYAGKAQEHAEKIAGQALSEVWSGRHSIPPPTDVGEY